MYINDRVILGARLSNWGGTAGNFKKFDVPVGARVFPKWDDATTNGRC